MAYGIMKYRISQDRMPDLSAYLDEQTRMAKLLRNAALFRIRNHFTAQQKESLTDNEQEVENEIARAVAAGMKQPKAMLTYEGLWKIMTVCSNPDYYAGLSMQCAQNVLKQACHDFKGWLAALKAYRIHPEKFLGKPRMPGYVKSDQAIAKYTNQDCRIQPDGSLKFPKTKQRLPLGHAFPDGAPLKEVQVIPEYGSFRVIVIYETEDSTVPSPGTYHASIDFGVNNLAAIVTDKDIPCRIYKGGAVKAANQWYNKRVSRLLSVMMKGKDPDEYHCPQTKQMTALARRRKYFLEDYFHKTAKDIVGWCVQNGIGTLVCGHTKLWKQKADTGKRNNQSFVQIPFNNLMSILEYLCARAGILFLEQEESYTSQASAVDRDPVPVFDGNHKPDVHFSGSRIRRGLYRTADGTCVNADLNGAANILRKAVPGAFAGMDVKAILRNISVVRFGNLYKVSG